MTDPLAAVPAATVIGIAAVAGLIVVVVVFKAMWRVAEPNQALVISGLKHTPDAAGSGEAFGFKIVVGRGVLVIPGVQAVRHLSLDLRETDLGVDCVTNQGIPLKIRGVVIFKVGDDYTSIANAARRFLDQEDQMEQRVHNVFAGHLRSIVGGLTVEEMIRDRARLTGETRDSSSTEMEKLGLTIDSLQIHEIDDPTGYITNLAAPHAAAVASKARIAQADADREATEKEQVADALKAKAVRDTQIQRAAYQADMDTAAAQAKQAGPLQEAQSRQAVIDQETEAARRQAELAEQQLQATVRRPADAQAYQQVTLANADRDARIAQAEAQKRETELAAEAESQRVRLTAAAEAERRQVTALADATAVERTGLAEAKATQARGEAEGAAIKARGLAVADAIKARSDALAENQDAVIGQQLAENAAAIVAAAAGAFNNVDNMIVLNGAEGVTGAMTSLVSQAGLIVGSLRGALTVPHKTDGNGSAKVPAPVAGSPPAE
ncbi:MAG: SPFH domain-containing protein [Acidimicrobiales bacterium]